MEIARICGLAESLQKQNPRLDKNMCLTPGPLPKTNHEVSYRGAIELRSKVKTHSQMPSNFDHFQNAHEHPQKPCIEVTDHTDRGWTPNSVDRAIPTRLKLATPNSQKALNR
jgi:hypothetical protein